MYKCIARFAMALTFSALSTAAYAEYPDKAVKLIVPYPPGQATDVVARIVADELAKEWGQAVYVENRGGGAAIPGMLNIRDSRPDGYTLAMGTSAAMAVNPGLFSDLPYDPLKDFELVAPVFRNPLLIVANSSSPYNSLSDLVEAAKKDPGGLNWTYPGTGTTQHLSGELFKYVAGIDIVGVMYKGSGPAVTDILGNQVSLGVDSIAATLPHIQSGKLKPLAMTGSARAPQMPEVPTVAELGYKGFSGEGWGGVIVPKGTPPEIIAKINADVRKVISSPAVQKTLTARGLVPDLATREEWVEFAQAELVKWGEVVRRANIKVN